MADCLSCGKELEKKDREHKSIFKKRKFCGCSCANSFNNNRLGTRNREMYPYGTKRPRKILD